MNRFADRLQVSMVALLITACRGDATDEDAPPRLSAGGNVTCALLDEDSFRCWGRNYRGVVTVGSEESIGDNEHPDSISAIEIDEGIGMIAPRDDHACLLDGEGRLRCWGGAGAGSLGFPWDGPMGALGDDEPAFSGPPVELKPRARQITTGIYTTCALLTDGAVKCWGNGEFGSTGLATTEDMGDSEDESPASLPAVDLGGPARYVAAARRHTCAVMTDGTVRCWGRDRYGTLGLGRGLSNNDNPLTIGDDEHPSSVPPIRLPGPGVEKVAAEGRQVCALHEEGAVSCWGETGPWLGYGMAMDSVGAGYGDDEHPDTLGLVDIGGKATDIVVGDAFSCALLDNGDVRCWGSGFDGELGYGYQAYIGYQETPAEAGPVPLGGKAVELAAGWHHACAMLENGDVRCWGEGVFGAPGYATVANVGDDETPKEMPPVRYR